MLKDKRVKSLLVGVAGLLLLAGILTTITVRSQQSNKQKAKVLRRGAEAGNQAGQPPTGKELDDAATPIVDFDNRGETTPDEKGLRQTKSARFDKDLFVLAEPPAGAGEIIRDSHWQVGLSDIPAEQSQLIVEGKVTDARAFLSNDKTGVYSEFTITVSRVLKTSPDLSVSRGDTIAAERFGGRVRYPSGKIIRYRIEGQGSPAVGKKYLLFLVKSEQGNYRLLTAYEQQGGKIFALDGSRINARGRGNWAFDKRNGEESEEFRKAVEEAINKGGAQQ